MASFYAYDFMFNSEPSRKYNLQIITFNDGSLFEGIGSSDVELYTQEVYRKAKPYFLGRQQSPVLKFELTFGSIFPIGGIERSAISKWLFGQNEYKKLYIIQDDLNGSYFNCFLTNPRPVYVGGVNYAFICNVVCDSPFAYSPLRTFTETFTDETIITYNFELYNKSHDVDYLYPNLTFTLNTIGDSFLIRNDSDNSREFLFEDLQPNEEITIDNDLQILTSSTGLKRLSKFNKNWLRLVPGLNELYVESGIGTFTVTYRDKLKIGG